MGLINVERFPEELSDALLMATMCLVDFPVDVYVRDGSIYSGIFHTASVEDEYGIVLKRASITKKRESDANITNEGIIETLVIHAGDLVQVVAQGVLLPADGIAGDASGYNVNAVASKILSSKCVDGVAEESVKTSSTNKKNIQIRKVQNENGTAYGSIPAKAREEHDGRKKSLLHMQNVLEFDHEKQDDVSLAKHDEASGVSSKGRHGDDRSQGDHDHKQNFQKDEIAHKFQVTTSSLDAPREEKLFEQRNIEMIPSSDTSPNDVSTSLGPVMNVASESCRSSVRTSQVIPHQTSESNRSMKEFKLNPGAKIFSPFVNSKSAIPAVPTVANMSYISNSCPAVPVATAHPEIGVNPLAPHSYVTVKYVPYSNLIPGNGGSGTQVLQPIVGPMGSQTQPFRYGIPPHIVQAGPPYVLPNQQAVMVGRLGGQLVYVHPVSQDLGPGVAAISLSGCPLAAQHQVQFPKHPGTAIGQEFQQCTTPPSVTGGQQLFTVPSQIQLLQPSFSANRSIVPGFNCVFGTKFP